VIDDADWTVHYLVVDTRNWWFGKLARFGSVWLETSETMDHAGVPPRCRLAKANRGAMNEECRTMLFAISGLQRCPVEGIDGRVGTVKGFLFDDQSWKVLWMLVDTGHWLPGHQILIHPSAIAPLDLNLPERRVLPIMSWGDIGQARPSPRTHSTLWPATSSPRRPSFRSKEWRFLPNHHSDAPIVGSIPSNPENIPFPVADRARRDRVMFFITHITLSDPALTCAIMSMGVGTANSILVVSFARERLVEGTDAATAAVVVGSSASARRL
jgi:hypothetical protein